MKSYMNILNDFNCESVITYRDFNQVLNYFSYKHINNYLQDKVLYKNKKWTFVWNTVTDSSIM